MDLDLAKAVVNGIIFATLVGIGCQLFSRRHYNIQIKYAHKLRARIEELLVQGKTGHSSSYQAKDILEELSIPSDSSVGERCIELEGYADYSGMVALHDLAAEEADSDDGRFSNAFPNLLISSLLVAGLLGTLLSLRETLSSEGMTEFITKEGMATASSFQEALRPVVKGFGHAFGASICGVFCTLVLICTRLSIVRRAREECFKTIEKLVVNQLLKFFIRPSQDSLREASQLLSKGGGMYSEAVSSIEAAATTVAKSVDGLEKAADQANQAFSGEGAIAGVLDQLIVQVGALEKSAAAIGKSEKKKTSALKELADANEKLHEKVTQRSEELGVQHSELVAMVGEKTKDLSETQTMLIKEFKESARSQGDKQSSLLAEMQVSISDLAIQLEKHPGSIEQLADLKNETIGAISATLRQQTQDFDNTVRTLQSTLSEYPNSLNSSIGKLETAVTLSHQNAGTGWNDLAGVLKELSQQNLLVADSMKSLGRNLETIVARPGGGGQASSRPFRNFWLKIKRRLDRVGRNR